MENESIINNNVKPCCIGKCLKKTGKILKNTGIYAGLAIAAVIFVVVHPIIGLLGSIGSLFAAAYHGISLNYHWRHTREKDENGKLIPGTQLVQIAGNEDVECNYNVKKGEFKASDIERLEHEKQRIYHVEQLNSSLKYARGLAKLTIPIIGLIWAGFTEMGAGGSMPESDCDDCMGSGKGKHWPHMSDKEKIEHHLNILKNPPETTTPEEEVNTENLEGGTGSTENHEEVN